MAEERVKLGKDMRTTIPQIAREVLELEEGDTVVFHSNIKERTVTLKKE